MLLSSRPSIGRSRGLVAPQQRTTESKSSISCLEEISTPISTPHLRLTPSASMSATRRVTTSFSSFMLGMPYMSSPPGRSARSYKVTRCPALLSWSAAASPAGPEPTTAIFLPVRSSGGCGVTQPSFQALSMIEHSIFLIVTAGSIRPKTQEPSQGAGQTRPVNSGKLLVFERRK